MPKIRVLYAEDDATLAFLTKDNLEQNNCDVSHFADGQACIEGFRKQTFDICILDIMMPKMDGFELATEIRKMDSEIPIIFLSAKTLKEDRIKGLKLGGDDYLIKPFSIEELVLKIGVFIKRSSMQKIDFAKPYQVGKFEFEPKNYSLCSSSENIVLTVREAELLKYFLDHIQPIEGESRFL